MELRRAPYKVTLSPGTYIGGGTGAKSAALNVPSNKGIPLVSVKPLGVLCDLHLRFFFIRGIIGDMILRFFRNKEMMPMQMQTDMNRIRSFIEKMAGFTDTPGEGVTRLSYGTQDLRAREYIIGLCEEVGLKVRTDSVGNIFARLEGKNPSLPVVMTGSHIDSVKNGGKFDGIVGCACGLEVARVMIESDHQPLHPIELVFFAEEEGSNFELSLMGSKTLIGKIDVNDLKQLKTSDGETAHDLILKAGFSLKDLAKDVLKKGDVKAYLEVHIEQSVRLDTEGHTLGIVPAIAGVKWFEVIFKGQAGHSGATPMRLRRDAMAAASDVISQTKHMARKVSETTVSTVGRVEIDPNVPNIIPGQVRFIVDIRDIKQSGIDHVVDELEKVVKLAADENDVDYSMKLISNIPPIELSLYLTEILENNAKKLGLDYIHMPSGALHDCGSMAEICDAAMIFVPSIGGHSHVPQENTKYEDIKTAADLLLMTILQLVE
jgi:hydantoinase/carbamoylase family amidase